MGSVWLDDARLQIATKPLAQATAMSLGESQVKHEETVEEGLHENAGDCSRSVIRFVSNGDMLTVSRVFFALD